MEIDPKELSRWLKANGKWDREKFSKELGITMKTSYMWTAGSIPISEKQKPKIEAMMNEERNRSRNVLSLRIDEEYYHKLEHIALKQGVTVSQLLKRAYLKEIGFSEEEIQEEMNKNPGDVSLGL